MINKTIKLRSNNDDVTLTTYVIDDILGQKKKRPAVVIFPGGGYQMCWQGEGEPYALEFARRGIHAFVATYSVSKPYPQALKDASRAVCIVREHADEWNIDVENIYVCGSSAGGHLAASLGVFWDKEPEIISDAQMNKPNGMILCYPVISAGEKGHKGSIDVLVGDKDELRDKMSLENQVSKTTPKTFLWHTFSDNCVPVENSLMFASALRAEDIPFEMHIYPSGNHGLSTGKEIVGEPFLYIQNWIDRACDWVIYNSGI